MKFVTALICLCAPASTYIEVYYDEVQVRQSIGFWGDFAQKIKISINNEMTRRE